MENGKAMTAEIMKDRTKKFAKQIIFLAENCLEIEKKI